MSDRNPPISLEHFAEAVVASVARSVAAQPSLHDRIIRYGGRIDLFVEVGGPQAESLGTAGQTVTR